MTTEDQIIEHPLHLSTEQMVCMISREARRLAALSTEVQTPQEVGKIPLSRIAGGLA